MQTVQVTRADVVGELDAYGEAYLVGAGACVLAFVCAWFLRSTPRGGAAESDAEAVPATR